MDYSSNVYKNIRSYIPFKTSPIQSLYAEADKTSPKLRWEKLALQYDTTKILSIQPHLSFYILPINQKPLSRKIKRAIRPFGLQMETLMKELKI